MLIFITCDTAIIVINLCIQIKIILRKLKALTSELKSLECTIEAAHLSKLKQVSKVYTYIIKIKNQIPSKVFLLLKGVMRLAL